LNPQAYRLNCLGEIVTPMYFAVFRLSANQHIDNVTDNLTDDKGGVSSLTENRCVSPR